ncbi:MAG: glycoside hydrolase family 32 protein [Chloroflexota bacterium]
MTNKTSPSMPSIPKTRQSPDKDPQRPLFHFLPPANWMNDPNGLIRWRGAYHLFYQYNPDNPWHERIHWGHAVSHDLVHWQDWPAALSPAAGGADKDGIWSGCAIDNDGTPTLLYSGVFPQVVCLATSDDGLRTWNKYAGNPVIASPPPSIDAGTPWEFRDPFVWREEDGWTMLMGTRVVNRGGAVLLYRSDNLVNWEYLHPLIQGDRNQLEPFWTGTIWECPNLLSFGDRHILIVSFQHHETGDLLYTGYFRGKYQNHRFQAESLHILDYGGHFYAPQVLREENGRYLLWGWLWEGRTQEACVHAGWAGVMTLPRELSLRPDGKLSITPAPQLQTLRRRQWHFHDLHLSSGEEISLSEVTGDTLEIEATFKPTAGAKCGLKVRCSPDGTEETAVLCDLAHGFVTIEREKSSLSPDVYHDLPPARQAVRNAPIPLTEDGLIRLHVFLDRSVIEVFINDEITLSSRIYPTRPDSQEVRLFAQEANVDVTSLAVWQMASIWDGDGT